MWTPPAPPTPAGAPAVRAPGGSAATPAGAAAPEVFARPLNQKVPGRKSASIDWPIDRLRARSPSRTLSGELLSAESRPLT
ncbi:hypothetical protein FLP10_10410 [Agromyces intestinalis]|uniref:Uncharacterized protein n=1 Tax=Agromyces intestinalis TaxID=2592652 RepID=A0A5C1YGX3_9MICO|nr:hypothetical protein FLP10_10410 [Agromyces intestinalis]